MTVEGPSAQKVSEELTQLEALIAAAPARATVKGMYIDGFLKVLDAEGFARPTKERFLSFKDYPLHDYMRMLLSTAAQLHAQKPPCEGLRLLGQLAFPTFADSMVGKVLLSVAGRNWKAALPLTERAYKLSLTPGDALLHEMGRSSAIMSLRDVWNFPTCYHVGILQGAMNSYDIQGTVVARPLARKCDVDLLLEWESSEAE